MNANVMHHSLDEFIAVETPPIVGYRHAGVAGRGPSRNRIFQQSHLVDNMARPSARTSSDVYGTAAHAKGRRAIDWNVRECAFA